MAFRSDVQVIYDADPRLVIVDAPSTEITIQDLHDTLSRIDDDFASMSYPQILSTSGKENLGGGVLVGLTLTLQNAQLAFRRRTDLISSGTITTAGTIGAYFRVITDTAATFITDGVERGYIVENLTDNSYAEVLTVNSETELTVLLPTGGSDNNYDFGDSYEIYLHETCDINGGNLVAVESDGTTILQQSFPTFGVGITKTSAASATLQEQQDIQYSSFGGGVTVDLLASNSGTVFPTGTPRAPVNNFADALTIATERGFTRLYIIGDATINSGLDFSSFEIVGESQNKSTFTIDPSANVTDCEFSFATIQGTLDGGNVLSECVLNGVNYIDGFVERCVLNGTTTLSGLDTAHFLDCYSGVPGTSTPAIDFQGSGAPLAMRNYNGGIELLNKSGAGAVSIDMNSGQVKIGNTVTNGTIILRGVGRWADKDSYTGGANVIDQLIKVDDVEQASFQNCVTIDTVNGESGTAYPLGTASNPVDNLTDAASIAASRGFNKICVVGNLTVTNVADWSDFVFEGENENKSTITFTAGAITNNVEVIEAEITGTISGNAIHVDNCILNGLTFNYGDFQNCGFRGSNAITGSATDQVRFINCYGAGNPISDRPSFDLGGASGPIVTVARYTGDMILQNKSGGGTVAINLHGGRVELQNTLTGGIVLVSGIGIVQDDSAGATVQTSMLTSDTGIVNELNQTAYDGVAFEDIIQDLLTMASGRIEENPPGTFTFYERDNTTVRYTLTKAGNERTRS